MPRQPTVRADRIEVFDPARDEYRYIEIDSDGDVYISDNTADDRASILIRQPVIKAVIKALRLAGKL